MKLYSPAADRNRQPIAEVLRNTLPNSGLVLEIASGSGQHAEYFARLFPSIDWQPTDCDEEAVSSILAHVEEASLSNLRRPLRLDVLQRPWPVSSAAAVVAANLIHISPWEVCEALVGESSRLLSDGSPLVLYGPYFIEGISTAPSNLFFDESLRARDPRWGVRDLEQVAELAARHRFSRERVIAMPANNYTVIFRKNAGSVFSV